MIYDSFSYSLVIARLPTARLRLDQLFPTGELESPIRRDCMDLLQVGHEASNLGACSTNRAAPALLTDVLCAAVIAQMLLACKVQGTMVALESAFLEMDLLLVALHMVLLTKAAETDVAGIRAYLLVDGEGVLLHVELAGEYFAAVLDAAAEAGVGALGGGLGDAERGDGEMMMLHVGDRGWEMDVR